MSEQLVVTKNCYTARRVKIMEKDTSKLDPFVMEEQFCVSGGQDRGLAGRRFTKPSLPNAANSMAHPRKDKKKHLFE